MTGTVKLRLNHYETLGVSPTATGDEIARAFAREGSVFRPHAFGGLAQLCIAYETLRDPIKRRAYDASLGLKPELERPNPPAVARPPVAQGMIARPSVAKPPIPPLPSSQPQPAFRLGPEVEPQVDPQPRLSRGSSPQLGPEEELGVEARPIDWKRAGMVLGGIVVAACGLGSLAGWWSASAIGETPQTDNMVSISLPPAKPVAPAETRPIAEAPAANAPKMRTAAPKRVVAAATPVDTPMIASEPIAAEEVTEESPPESTVSAETAETEPATPAVAASMPLPDRVVARTIERIGYSCGSVASTEPVDGGASGVFKVNCSSGQSYQAKPVRGRYHFRRWGKR